MNYFAHAIQHLDDPWFVAGTAVPDWLSVVNRKSRARARYAQPLVDDSDPRAASIARGILQHHTDDDWFHQSAAFNDLSLHFAVELRELLGDNRGFRTGFLGHILVELLLDAHLIESRPGRLDDYYNGMESLDPQFVQATVNRIVKVPVGLLGYFITRFNEERFLADYPSDERLLYRLNGVMRRVKLNPLPESLVEFFPQARQRIQNRHMELLTPPGMPMQKI